MKTWIVDIETRKGDRDTVLGPFLTFEKAQEALLKYFGEWIKSYTEYDSDFSKGCIYTEENSAEIYERELQ